MTPPRVARRAQAAAGPVPGARLHDRTVLATVGVPEPEPEPERGPAAAPRPQTVTFAPPVAPAPRSRKRGGVSGARGAGGGRWRCGRWRSTSPRRRSG